MYKGDRSDRGERGERGDKGRFDRGGDGDGDGNDRGDKGEGDGGRRGSRSKYRAEYPGDFRFDYKDPLTLSRFVGEMGKITPSRISKLSRPQQTAVSNSVKKARSLAMLALGTDAYDEGGRPEQIHTKPFSID